MVFDHVTEPAPECSRLAASTAASASALAEVGFVVIARNGGPRLSESLASVATHGRPVVYVDSASTDRSAELAESMGCVVVRLFETDSPNASKARNAGSTKLRELAPGIRWIQFVDGDTTIDRGFPLLAAEAMNAHPEWTVTCGHLRERFRDSNVFRRVLDLDWAGPTGEVISCGGNAMIRVAEFAAVGGFDPAFSGGEEANLAERLRDRGGRVVRLDLPMGEHDSGIDTLGSWWRRTERVGYWNAGAAASGDTGRADATKRRVRSALLWGGIVPALVLGSFGCALVWPVMAAVGLALIAAFPALMVRITLRRTGPHRVLYGWFCVLAKFPQFQGQLRCWLNR